MQDNFKNSNYSDLISRYLSGNANDAEIRELETWVMADLANKEHFVAFKKAWILSGMKQNDHPVDVDQLWNETAAQLFEESKVVRLDQKKSRRNWLAVAATIAILLVGGLWFFQNTGVDAPLIVSTTNDKKSIDLPDGSHVVLNQSSSLEYLESKSDKRRTVKLNGDAFFDVARDEDKPFVITANEIEIEVLGTSFYVDAREGQSEVQVIVESGSVSVNFDSTNKVLKAGEKAVFRKDNRQLAKAENEDPNFNSIKNDTLKFNETSLEDFVFALNRHYNANITIENEILKSCEIQATYSNQSLDSILRFLEVSHPGIQVQQNGKNIVLKGVACE